MRFRVVATLAVLLCLSAPFAYGGRILVANDEFTFADSKWSTDAGIFVNNVFQAWFGLQPGDKVLLYTNHWPISPDSTPGSINQGDTFYAALESIVGAGNVVWDGTGATDLTDLAGLNSTYKAIIVGGYPIVGTSQMSDLNNALVNFVTNNNNVFLMLGTGAMSPAGTCTGLTPTQCKPFIYPDEIAAWAAFMQTFGLTASYNTSGYKATNYDVSGYSSTGNFGSTLYSGMSGGGLYFYQDVSIGLNPGGSMYSVLIDLYQDLAGNGLWAAVEFQSAPIPEPATYVMLGAGLAALGLMRRYRRL